MEARDAARYWARKLRARGHDVQLIPPQFFAPYRKGSVHVKDDALDALAICEAARRSFMRFVPVKLPAQRQHDDRLLRWIVELQARVIFNKTLVAVADKHE